MPSTLSTSYFPVDACSNAKHNNDNQELTIQRGSGAVSMLLKKLPKNKIYAYNEQNHLYKSLLFGFVMHQCAVLLPAAKSHSH
jgi:hypothetical protein